MDCYRVPNGYEAYEAQEEKKIKAIYSLTAEDLTNLGGPMGTEYTETMWIKYFTSKEKAKKYAEKHFKGSLKWIKNEDGGVRTPDMGWVMYYINLIKVVE